MCDTPTLASNFKTFGNWTSKTVLHPQNYKWQNGKVWILHRRNPTLSSSQSSIAAMKNFLEDGRLTPLSSPPLPPPPPTPSGAPLNHPYSPCPAGCGEWGWSERAPGQYQSGQHYYCGWNAEQTPPPFPSMSTSSSLYVYSFLFCHL